MGAENQKEQPKIKRQNIASAVLAGGIAGYFITTVLSHFHPALYEFILIALASLVSCQFLAIVLFERFSADPINHLRRRWVTALNLLLAFLFAVSAMNTALQFPGLFHSELLFMHADRLAIFGALAFTLMGCFIWFSDSKAVSSAREQIKLWRLFQWTEKNIPGVFLSACFFLIYFTFAETINFPTFRTLDLYFDFDVSAWLERFTARSVPDLPEVRAVHPALLLIVRPLVWLLSLFLNGDRLHALFLLHALTGAACVFTIWLIVKRMTNQTAFALLIASLLGASASQVLLGSMIETYIYSAFGLILFSWVMHTEKVNLRSTLVAGILIAGITISNFAQTCILFLATRPKWKSFLSYILVTTAVIFIMNNLQVRLYPTARLLFDRSSLGREQGYRFNPLNSPAWKTQGRLSLTARAIALYGIVAPTPFILDDELGAAGIPHFRTFKITVGEFHVAGYSGFADVTVRIWIIIFASALVLFSLDFFKSPISSTLPAGLLICLMFNFVLHTLYGDDPLLYSPDWVFALVLFFAHAFKRFADHTWFQFVLLTFLAMVMIVNLGLIDQIMEVSAPLYGR